MTIDYGRPVIIYFGTGLGSFSPVKILTIQKPVSPAARKRTGPGPEEDEPSPV